MSATTVPTTTQAAGAGKNGFSSDRDFYTWSSFFNILVGSASQREQDAYFRARDEEFEGRDIARCEKDKEWLFKYSPIIRFMKHNIDLLGPESGAASISPANVRCRRCVEKQSGGFDPEYGILICSNQIRNRGHLEDTLAHEMVHAYDHMRFKLDPLDLRHAACMEIRASTLSGECRWTREFFTRGQWSLTQQMQRCVRRRAALSVAQRPACDGDSSKATRIVDEVWDSCFKDTRPFDEIYR